MNGQLQQGSNSALEGIVSGNQDARHDLVRRIFGHLGIQAKSDNLLHDYQGKSRPSVMIQVVNPHDRKHSLYTAAYHGLLANEPGQLVFHPGHGEDHLHSIRLQGDPSVISGLFDKHQIPQRHLIPMKDAPNGPEFRVLVYDRGGKLKQNMANLAQESNGQVFTQKGSGFFIGGPDQKSAHEHYRHLVRKLDAAIHGDPNKKDIHGFNEGSLAQKYYRKLIGETEQPTQMSRRVKKYAKDKEDELAFQNSIVNGDQHPASDITPHLVYTDWLEENGRGPIARMIRKGLTDPIGHDSRLANPGVRRGAGTPYSDLTSTQRFVGSHGALDFFIGRSTPETFYFKASPEISRRAEADRGGDGIPYHYQTNLTSDEVHAFADELEQEGGAAMAYRIRELMNQVFNSKRKSNPPTQMSRRGKPVKKAAFSTDPRQQLNISVPLPEAVPSKPQAAPAPSGPPVKSFTAPATPQFQESPVKDSTILPYYAEQQTQQPTQMSRRGKPVKKSALKPGEPTEFGKFEPLEEPDLVEFVINQYRKKFGDPQKGISASSGYLLPDGRSVPLGPEGYRYEDHRSAVPSAEAAKRWGWNMARPETIEKGERTLRMIEMMRRAKLVRVDAAGDALHIHHAHVLTPEQRRALISHVNQYKPSRVIIENHGGSGADLSNPRGNHVAAALDKSNEEVAAANSATQMSRRGKPVKKSLDAERAVPGLAQSVQADPHDHAARGVLADALEESNQHHDPETLNHLRNFEHPVYGFQHPASEKWVFSPRRSWLIEQFARANPDDPSGKILGNARFFPNKHDYPSGGSENLGSFLRIIGLPRHADIVDSQARGQGSSWLNSRMTTEIARRWLATATPNGSLYLDHNYLDNEAEGVRQEHAALAEEDRLHGGQAQPTQMSRRGSRRFFSRDEVAAIANHMNENPDDLVATKVFADALEENGLHANDGVLERLRDPSSPPLVAINRDGLYHLHTPTEAIRSHFDDIIDSWGIYGGIPASIRRLADRFQSLGKPNLAKHLHSVADAHEKPATNERDVRARCQLSFVDNQNVQPVTHRAFADGNRIIRETRISFPRLFGGHTVASFSTVHPRGSGTNSLERAAGDEAASFNDENQQPTQMSRQGKVVKFNLNGNPDFNSFVEHTKSEESTPESRQVFSDFLQENNHPFRHILQDGDSEKGVYFNSNHPVNWGSDQYPSNVLTFHGPDHYFSVLPTKTHQFAVEGRIGHHYDDENNGTNEEKGQLVSKKNPIDHRALVDLLDDAIAYNNKHMNNPELSEAHRAEMARSNLRAEALKERLAPKQKMSRRLLHLLRKYHASQASEPVSIESLFEGFPVKSLQRYTRAKAPAGGWYEQTPFGLAIPIEGGKFMPKDAVPPQVKAPVRKERQDGTSDFTGCLMAPVSPHGERLVHHLRDQIPDLWVEEDETHPHVTLLHGFSSGGDLKARLSEALSGLSDEASVQVKGLDVFDGNALVLKLDSPALNQANEKLKGIFENKQTHPEYTPHMTICYLKPEAVSKVKNILKIPRTGAIEIDLDNLVYSRGDGKKYLVRLEK